MKILMMGSVYPRSHEDSEVPWMRETVARLVDQGIEVEILAPSWRGLASHTIDGVKVHRFRYAPASWEFLTHDEGAPSKLARNPLFQLLAIPYILIGTLVCFYLTLRNQYDLLHVHWPFPHGLMALPTRWILRKPMVLNFHGASLLLQRKFKFVGPCLNFVIGQSQGVLANSSFTRERILEVRETQVMLSPYGSPLDQGESSQAPMSEYSFKALDEYHTETPFKILFVGRHIERKGIEYLIEAFQHLLKTNPSLTSKVQLDIVGGGESTDSLKELAQRTPEFPIVFPGKVSNEELEAYYHRANLFVLPAIIDRKGDTEGLGVVLVEAIQSDTPIIASQVGGIIDVIKHNKTGLLVPEQAPGELSQAILEVINSPEEASMRCREARRHANEFFDWSGITQRLMEYYQERLK